MESWPHTCKKTSVMLWELTPGEQNPDTRDSQSASLHVLRGVRQAGDADIRPHCRLDQCMAG